MSKQYKQGKPDIKSFSGSTRVRHREYLTDIPGSSAWTLYPFQINPGLSVFTWLNSLANLYESYLFNSLSFEFDSTSSTAERGSVMLAIDYDAADSPPGSKQELMAMEGAVRSAPWESSTYKATSADLHKFGVQRYVRSAALASNLDIKTYDVGTFYCAVQGTSAVTSVGELYIVYDVTFYTPQSSQALISGYSARANFVSALGSAPFGSAPLVYTGGLPLRYRDGNSLWIDKIGSYIITFESTGTGIDNIDLVTCTINGAATGIFGSTQQLIGIRVNGTTDFSCTFRVQVNQIGAYLGYIVSNVTTLTSTVMRIGAYQYSLA